MKNLNEFKTENQEWLKNVTIDRRAIMCPQCNSEGIIYHNSVSGDNGIFYTQCPQCGQEWNIPWKRTKTVEGLTSLECEVLEFLCRELAIWRENEPGYSCVGGTEITAHMKINQPGWNAHSTAGVVSNLCQKGYCAVYPDFKNTVYVNWEAVPDNFGRRPQGSSDPLKIVGKTISANPNNQVLNNVTKQNLIDIMLIIDDSVEEAKTMLKFLINK